MGIPKSRLLLLICGSALFLVSCQQQHSARQAAVAPPRQALAPATSPAPATAPPVESKPAAVPEPHADPVAELVTRAESEYQQGQANQLAGNPEAARQNFDNALNLLGGTAGGAPAGAGNSTQSAASETPSVSDLASDPRVEAEREKITAARSQLELGAGTESEANGPPATPAPIDEANSVTPPVDPQVKAKAEAELKTLHSDLPLVMNDYVAGYINYFTTRGRGVLERALERAGRYRAMIESTLAKIGVPRDLIYLAQAESGFQPLALSREGARGMWQFMASRGNAYGLERNRWVDERQDPAKSTLAAAKHLKDLYSEFGDWYLAMAAYNSGPVNVQRAVQRTGFADFWELYKRDVLPKETKNYVPIILAMTIIAKNPAQYGFTDIQPDPPLADDTVEIDYAVDLRLVAQCVDAPLTAIQDLNPSLLRLTTPADATFELHLPPGAKDQFQQAIAAIPRDKREWWRYHTVTGSETLVSIARAYHVSAVSISEVNGLGADEIGPQTKLLIPLAPGHYAPGERTRLTYSRHPTRYRVRRGDTVTSVAADFGVPTAKLRSWNRLRGDRLRAGRRLVIYRPVEVTAADRPHKIRRHKRLRRVAHKRKPLGTAASSSASAVASASGH